MTARERFSFYEKRKTSFSQDLSVVQKKINLVSNLRLATAIIFLLVLYFGFSNHDLLYGTLPLLALFVVWVQRHSKLFEEKVHLENLVKLNDAECRAVSGDYESFATGVEFIDPHHPYTHDLDIFGEGSLFQAINRCNTLSGKKKFADRLSVPLPSAQEINEHQAATDDLS